MQGDAKIHLGITQKCDTEQHILSVRNDIIRTMHTLGYSTKDIATVVRLDKAGVSRVIRFGSNRSQADKNIIK